jgi:hypothetical protein
MLPDLLFSCLCCLALDILSSAFFPGCTILTVSSGCLVLSRLSSPSVLYHLFCPTCPLPAVLLNRALVPTVRSLLSCSGILTYQSCPGRPAKADLSGRSFQTDLSVLSCPVPLPMSCSRCQAPNLLSRLSCHGCPISVVLCQLPCSSVMFWPSCPLCLVLPVPSRLSSLAVLSWLSCPGFPVLAVLFQQSSPQLFCPNCPVLVVMFSLSCPIYFILHPLS